MNNISMRDYVRNTVRWSCDDSLLDAACEILDSVVFDDQKDAELFDTAGSGYLKDEYNNHLKAMIERAENAMIDYANEHKNEFIEEIRNATR